MKYEVKLENIILDKNIIKSININILKQSEVTYVNDKNKIELVIEGNIFSNDNDKNKNNLIIKKLIEIKDKYFDAHITVDDMQYSFPNLYIYKFIQKFLNGSGDFILVLNQKFIGINEEIKVDL